MSAYSLRIIEDKNLWDGFVASQAQHTFLHSSAYADMQEKLGERVWRFGMWQGEKLCGVMLVIKIHARRGDFLFVPHGPLVSSSELLEEILKTCTAALKEIAQKEGASFVRISPLFENTQENKKQFQTLGFRDAPIHMHPEITWTLPLAKSEQELLAEMRKTTRNLIGRAQREGVQIRIGTSDKDFEDFYNLYKQTAAKQGFVPFSHAYLSTELEAFTKYGAPAQGWSASGGKEGAAIILGFHNGKVQAGAFVVFYGDSAFYHHGASTLEDPKIPVPYLVQWAAIQEAKKRGKKFYNFWGIVPQENSSHPWAGLSLFKMGFGGFRTDYLHAQDLPLSSKYWLNWVVETVRRARRSY